MVNIEQKFNSYRRLACEFALTAVFHLQFTMSSIEGASQGCM